MAEMSKAEMLLRLGFNLAGASLMGSSPAGNVFAGALRSATGTNDENDFVASRYPHPKHTVNVTYLPGPAQLNRLLQRGVSERASKMQTIEQHNNALLKYLRNGMTPKERHAAIMRGIAEEEALPEYWDDKKPRVNYTPSSSVVKGIRVTPDNRVEVQFGSNGKWYTYKQHPDPYRASLAASRLINSDSIGRALCRKSKKPGVGGWGRSNYDRSMV